MYTLGSCHSFKAYWRCVCVHSQWPAHRTKQSQHYLLVLREPSISRIFKSSYIGANLSLEEGPDQSQNPTFSIIQPMKDALYFDDIEGFGEWSILLSTRAQKDLRDVKRADGAVFRIVMKKIKCDFILRSDNCC